MKQALAFQLTAARRRLGGDTRPLPRIPVVSTHSRPKAAGQQFQTVYNANHGFNSQPPEGGWLLLRGILLAKDWFQLTAARRRLVPPLKPLTGKACIALFR